VGRHHLEEAVDRAISGPRRQARLIPPDEKRRIATHEAGHAVVAAAFGKGDELDKVSVIARGGGVGHLAMLSEDKTVLTRDDMEADIAVAMAGIAAEELVLGQPSTGSEADLERATNTARDMAGRYGMSARVGRVRLLREHGEVFLGRDYLSSRDVSQPTLEHLDEEVRQILDVQEQAAHKVLSSHRRILDELAQSLIAQETVQGTDLERALAKVRPYLKVAKAAPARAPRARKGGTGA
jgi:cell division protease FtsH